MSIDIYHHEPPGNDVMNFTVFLAGAFHIILILGLSFTTSDDSESDSAPTLEVTLSTSFTKDAPEDADFIGQSSQEGGGNVDEKIAPKAKEDPEFNELNPEELSSVERTQSAQRQQTETQRITTTNPNALLLPDYDPQPLKTTEQSEVSQINMTKRTLEIASLEAEIHEDQVAYANRPRKTFIQASVKAHDYAFYLKEWTNRIESVGNKRYPDEAKRRKLYGEVTVSVSIAQDGTLVDSKVLLSSGHKILDDAALRIVRLSAPFSALTAEIKKDTDILVITRVWEFKKGNRVKTRSR